MDFPENTLNILSFGSANNNVNHNAIRKIETIKLTNAGRSPGFPLSTQTAVELSCGSYGHLAMPKPMPGTYSERGKCVKFDCGWGRGVGTKKMNVNQLELLNKLATQYKL